MVDYSNLRRLDKGVYLGKDRLGWKLVHPWRNEDRTINWFNLLTGGSWWKLLLVTGIVLLILVNVAAYKRDTNLLIKNLNYVAENPCEWCDVVTDLKENPQMDIPDLVLTTNLEDVAVNLSEYNLSGVV